MALRPDIFFWKRTAAVSFNVSYPIVENILLSIDCKLSVNSMSHTVNTVSALHKRNKSERPHDVILNWRKSGKTKYSICRKLIIFNVQSDAVFIENIFTDFNHQRILLILQRLKWDIDSCIICNHLK